MDHEPFLVSDFLVNFLGDLCRDGVVTADVLVRAPHMSRAQEVLVLNIEEPLRRSDHLDVTLQYGVLYRPALLGGEAVHPRLVGEHRTVVCY